VLRRLEQREALYEWNYAAQLLHLRAAEGKAPASELEQEVYQPRYLVRRPLLQALQAPRPARLLIDEVDRADEPFEAFLLEYLGEYQVSIPELGTVRAAVPPVTLLTSNRTRELNDAVKRRCLYHWLDYPERERELAIVRALVPEAPRRLADQVAAFVQQLRSAPYGEHFSARPASPRRWSGRARWWRWTPSTSTPRSSWTPPASCSSSATTWPRSTARWPTRRCRRPARRLEP
jgi:MoxR-like ATPase